MLLVLCAVGEVSVHSAQLLLHSIMGGLTTRLGSQAEELAWLLSKHFESESGVELIERQRQNEGQFMGRRGNEYENEKENENENENEGGSLGKQWGGTAE